MRTAALLATLVLCGAGFSLRGTSVPPPVAMHASSTEVPERDSSQLADPGSGTEVPRRLKPAPQPEALQLEFDELTAAATATLDTVAALERNARAQGHRLHPSLVAQRALVESFMDSAERALRQSEWAILRERLTRARAAIERLNRML
ncbi:MAG: hypothetical protein U0Q16_19700 [Bryobacteraceae bacterium]